MSGTIEKLSFDFQYLFESLPGLYLILTPELKIITASDAYLQATMTRRNEIAGKPLFEVFPDNPNDPSDGVANLRKSLNLVVKDKVSHTMALQKYDVRNPAGVFEERFWSPQNKPVFNSKKEIVCIVHRVEDVTEKVRMAKETAEKIKIAADLEENKALTEQRTNVLLESLLKFTQLDFTQKIEVSEKGDELDAIAVGLNTLSEELESHIRQIKESREALIEMNNSLERKVEERTEKIKRYSEELERSNRELEQFAYIASHDLQEPLRMVGSYMQLLQKRYKDKLDEDANEFIHYAVDGATRMKQLVNDLLSYSRTNKEGEFSSVNLAQVMNDVLKNLEASITESKAVINFTNMPVVHANKTQVMQLFQNLISNAIKFRKDEIDPAINMNVEKVGPNWLFSVQDNGIGIDEQYSDKIFIIFKQLHDKSKYKGTGIGLAIAKKIVERHGGKIWFESAPGKGTTFYFTLKS